MNLKVTLIQSELYWQNKEANLAMFEERIWQIEEATDLIVLPEMFSTGFTMQAKELAEPMNFHTFRWLVNMAKRKNSSIVGSFIVKENDKYFNRLMLVKADETFFVYDKRHLFRMAKEHETFSEGTEKVFPEIKGWKILPLVCYDLRFPVWSRNVNLEYDALIYVANWPKARRTAWQTLLKARAVENLAYVVGVNRVGKDGNDIEYAGDSAVIDPKGHLIFEQADTEFIQTFELDKEALDQYRQKFPAYLDADNFEIKL